MAGSRLEVSAWLIATRLLTSTADECRATEQTRPRSPGHRPRSEQGHTPPWPTRIPARVGLTPAGAPPRRHARSPDVPPQRCATASGGLAGAGPSCGAAGRCGPRRHERWRHERCRCGQPRWRQPDPVRADRLHGRDGGAEGRCAPGPRPQGAIRHLPCARLLQLVRLGNRNEDVLSALECRLDRMERRHPVWQRREQSLRSGRGAPESMPPRAPRWLRGLRLRRPAPTAPSAR